MEQYRGVGARTNGEEDVDAVNHYGYEGMGKGNTKGKGGSCYNCVSPGQLSRGMQNEKDRGKRQRRFPMSLFTTAVRRDTQQKIAPSFDKGKGKGG